MALRRTRLVQSLPSPAVGVGPKSQSSIIGHITLVRSKQESPVREIRTLGLTWRGLETGSRFG